MLRSDFDNHQLWGKINEVEVQINQIGQDHQSDEMANIERIRVQISYVRSFVGVASTRSAFFHSLMLDAVQKAWEQGATSLAQRISRGIGNANFVESAASEIEQGLLQMGPWPRPYGKGGEVKQMSTLFEDLLEAQRLSIVALEKEHQAIFSQVEDKKEETINLVSDLDAKLGEIDTKIQAEQTLIAAAIRNAENKVEALTKKNSDSYEKWISSHEEKFDSDVESLKATIQKNLRDADEEYSALLSAKEKYTHLVSAIAADEVAAQFESEATWGRNWGLGYYIVGFTLLIAASIPLVWLIFEPEVVGKIEDRWSSILLRISIGVLAGSAAAISFRMGSRLVNNANSIKRMELELRAIGPFLANVSKKDQVDKAFIDLVSNAFGKTYADQSVSGNQETSGGTVSLEALSQVIDLAQKINKLGPPGAVTDSV